MIRISKQIAKLPLILVNIKCKIIYETEKAILIQIDDEKYWIPLSQVFELHKVDEGLGEGSYVRMTEWIAREKGLI